MKKLIQRLLGLDLIIKEKQKTNALLSELLKEMKRNSDLVETYNRAYHIH